MISFRQHVVTIVAIFLALALGMLAGSAFVQPRLVDQLRAQVEEQRRTMDALREQVGELRDRLSGGRAFDDAALPYLVAGRLAGERVVVIVQEGLGDAALAEARRALEAAGATAIVLEARSTLLPEDPTDAAALADLLGLAPSDPSELPTLAAAALAERLATDARRDPSEQDLLRRLLTEGYLVPTDANLSDAVISAAGGPRQPVVVLAGGTDEAPPMPPSSFAVPLVERLAELGLPVAAAEPVGSAVPFVEVLRASGPDGVVTVEGIDESRGGAALVLGLERRILTGDGGDYGIGAGSEPIPPMP